MVHILVVEDEKPLRVLLDYNLAAAGYRVTLCDSGDQAEELLQEESFDLILLDWRLPGVSGIELCRRVRACSQTATVPLVMLTACGEESERLRGLTMGADDYIVKPFSLPELMIRIRTLLRRTASEKIAPVLTCGPIVLNRISHLVTYRGFPVTLGPTEYRLLIFLMESPRRVFSRTQLLDGVWGRNSYLDFRTVDVHIGRLRKGLCARHQEENPIRTVRGIGYALEPKD